MKLTNFLTLLLLIPSAICQAQLNDPMSIAKKIFAQEPFQEIEEYVTGEYNGSPNGTNIPSSSKVYFTLLDRNNKTAVVNISVIDSMNQVFDAYLHFVKEDKNWKVTALRALAVTGITEQVKMMLESMTESQVDSLVTSSNHDSAGYSLFNSKAEYDFQLGNSRLTLASDEELISHFQSNKLQFEQIKDEVISKGILSSKKSLEQLDNNSEIRQRLDKLFINNVSPDENYSSPENLNFNIGGMIDNTVGYLYVNDLKNLPKMSPDLFIMIREIGNGWYLYKTT